MWTRLTGVGREERTLELLLRVGVAGCFIGHGAFGILGKEAWLPYFGVAGIGEEWAWTLMPVVGMVDILLGIAALVSPRPAILAYAAGWALWTALLRPLAGESVFEALERAGNYGVPLAFLILAGASRGSWRTWLRPVRIPRLTPERRRTLALVLRATVVALLAGHGGLAFTGKAVLVEHAAVVGLSASAVPVLGALELALAVTVAIHPMGAVLLAVLGWKLATEALYPVAGAPFWEFVERAGSYAAPLALWILVRRSEPALVPSGSAARRTVTAALVPLIVGLGATRGAEDRGGGPDGPATAEPDTTLLQRVRSGGLVLACRHAVTDRSRGDARRVDLSDPSTQRVLSEEGRDQARRLGRILRERAVPVGRVLTSPYARTAESAELAFGTAEVHDALHGGGEAKRRALTRLLSEPPGEGGNRVLMTHQGILYRMLPDVPRGSIREGDCLVVQPAGGGRHEVLARLGPDGWEGLR